MAPISTSLLDPRITGAAAQAAELVRAGGLIAVNFNGGFAFLGDAECLDSAELIFHIKQRPREKTLALVCAPDAVSPFVNHDALVWSMDRIISLQTRTHALGVILPANLATTPAHLQVGTTILNVWSEYAPLRSLFAEFHARGGTTFHGASANMSGQPTLITTDDVMATFGGKIDAVYADPSLNIPAHRRRSTSLLDLTTGQPILRRSGNVPIEELQPIADEENFGRIHLADQLKYV